MASDREAMKGICAPLPLDAAVAYWHASSGIPYEPTYVPIRVDRDCPKDVMFFLHPKGLGAFTSIGGARGDFDCNGPIDDSRINDILCWPPAYKPKNPHYVKTHANAPGTVRSWFRQMRAADFERDAAKVSAEWGGYFFLVAPDLRGRWTLFDTQQVVDRVIAAHYESAAVIDLDDPHCFVEPYEESAEEYIARHGGPEEVFKRSEFPAWRATVPTSSRGITLEDLQRFVDFDDARRSERVNRRGDPASPGAGREPTGQ